MQLNHPLPFPVRNTADLRRAIQYASREEHASTRHYVTTRARVLGRADMLPSWWGAARRVAAPKRAELDDQFVQLSQRYGISVAKLRAVYFRGVGEFMASETAAGSAMIYGLARVQRFVNALENGGPFFADEDLVQEAPPVARDPGLEVSIDSDMIISDVVYSVGAMTAKLFEPGEVHAISIDNDTITVEGTLDDTAWVYSLNTVSGAHSLQID